MTADAPPTFGILLGRYRVAAGLTQEELAERAGLSVEAISALERGVRTRPRTVTVRRLADALQLSSDDRASFEETAHTATTVHDAEALPVGNFLGALPPGEIVGREEECERIRLMLDAVVSGSGHLLLLNGEVGVGKTRLLQEVMVEASARYYVVLTGRCYADEQGNPYYPLLELLSELTVGAPAAIRPEVQRGWKRVQQLVGGRSARNSGETGTQVEQQQLFGAVSDLLLLVARSVPLAILFDDLQWADGDSLKLLQYLAHTCRSSPVLLAGSFCDHRLGEKHAELAQTIQVMSHERLLERLSVRRLSLEETTQLVAVTMGRQDVSEEFASFVYHRTKGIPRLIDQLVRSLGGRLELQGEIGAGSMGRVFRAWDRILEKAVAAKLVLARSEIDLDTLLRFQQEGAVLARLEHPHIVRIYDTFAEEHATCIIMELLDGNSLGQILRAGPLSLSRAQHLALQVADALSYAHAQSIVHRDIKPDNVMVLLDDQVKMTDFGIARILQPDTSLETIATTGMRMGTPLYMAPEQIEGKKIDGRADLYGLGAMLYHMVTGRPPFEGNDALAIAVKHLQEEPLPPSSLNPGIPSAWDFVILKAMAKETDQRYQSAGEFRQAIAGLPKEQAGALPVFVGQHGTARGAWKQARVLPRLVSGVSVASICLVAVLWLHALSPGSSAPARALAGAPIAVWGVKIPASLHFRLAGSLSLKRGHVNQADTPILPGRDPEILSAPVRGNVYIGDYSTGTILRVSTAGKLLAAWGTKGKGPRQIENINDIAVDSHGSVYVADGANNRISKFSADGKFLASFGQFGFNPGQFSQPSGIAVAAEGTMYVADSFNDRIQKLSATGKPLLVWGSPGPAPDQVYGPNSVRLDAHGNVWVGEFRNLRIHEFSPSGKSLAIIGGPGTGPGEFTNPQSFAFDPQGNIYVVDEKLARVEKFTPTGKLLAVWDAHGSRPGQFKDPWTITIDREGHVYIADFGNGRVEVLSTNGKRLAEWKISDLLRPLFQRPLYVVLDHHGNAYVSDPGHNAIEKLSSEGDLLLQWGRAGIGPGKFRHPAGIALDAAGNVYVADSGNGRIQEFSSGGTFVAAWPMRIAGTNRRGSPTGLAIDRQGSIYVTDPVSAVVQGYTTAHKLRIQWGKSDANHPLYWLKGPTAIAVDRQDNVYVADTGNHRVVEYAAADIQGTNLPLSHPTESWGGARGPGPSLFLQPTGVAVDARGDVYVTDSSASRVQVFNSLGTLIAKWGASGSDPGRFRDPTGIGLDVAGNIYVVDSGNARVQKFLPAN